MLILQDSARMKLKYQMVKLFKPAKVINIFKKGGRSTDFYPIMRPPCNSLSIYIHYIRNSALILNFTSLLTAIQYFLVEPTTAVTV